MRSNKHETAVNNHNDISLKNDSLNWINELVDQIIPKADITSSFIIILFLVTKVVGGTKLTPSA